MTPDTWHLLKITVDSSGHTTVYVDDMNHSAADANTSWGYNPGAAWTLSLGDFVGCIDDVRISNTLR